MSSTSIFDVDPQSTLRRLEGSLVHTPVRRLHWLERLVGVPVYAKLEHQQHTGSFKYRGALLAVERRAGRPVIAASAGNHGLAVAQVCAELGVPVDICVPVTASRLKRERILATGAGLIEHGNSLERASEHALALSREHDLHYISPYNNLEMIAGAATLGAEILMQTGEVAAMVAPIGGGGLISGLALAAKAAGAATSMVGCEPERYSSMTASVRAGRPTRVTTQPTFADGLAVNLEPESMTVGIVAELVDDILLLSEEELAAACLALLVHESLLVEPAGAAAVVACLRLAEAGRLDGPVALPLCGGNVHHTTLSRIQRMTYTDPSLIRLLDLRGPLVDDVPVVFSQPYGRAGEPAPGPGTSSADLRTQLESTAVRLRQAVGDLEEFADYCRVNSLPYDQHVLADLRRGCEAASRDIALAEEAMVDGAAGWQASGESVLRRSLATLAHARGALEWCSPAYAQSHATQFFDTMAQDSPSVNYERYGHPAARRVEDQLQQVLDLPTDEFAVTVTSSGMAAYSLIEAFLLRERLSPQDTVLLAPYIYFEASEHLQAIPFLRIRRCADYSVQAILAAVAAERPRVLFIDPIANTAEQRMIDLPAVLEALRDSCDSPITVVIDGTMSSGALPAETLRSTGNVEVLYYESCSKYLQLGLDAGMAGTVAYPSALRPRFERIRRNTGTILYRHQAELFPVYDRQFFRRRMGRISANALAVATAMAESPGVSELGQVFLPAHPSHQDQAVARRMPYSSGCVNFRFHDSGMNNRDELEALIDGLLTDARRHGVPVTKGVSFGFSVPRVSAAASMAESEPPFLRVYVGDQNERNTRQLAEAVIRAVLWMGEKHRVPDEELPGPSGNTREEEPC